MTVEPLPLINFGRSHLPGEIAWWFADGRHVEDLALSIRTSEDLSYRASAIYVANQWYFERQSPLPTPLLDVLAELLEVDVMMEANSGLRDNIKDVATRCAEVVAWWRRDTDQRNSVEERRRRSPAAIPVGLRRSMLAMICQFADRGISPPGEVLYALAHMLGLVSPVNGRPLPAAKLLKLIGLPSDVDRLDAFLRAAQLDGQALQRAQSTTDHQTAFDTADVLISARLFANQWALQVTRLSRLVGVSRPTIRSWRSKAEYRRIARFQAIWPSMHRTAWAQWNRPRQRAPTT